LVDDGQGFERTAEPCLRSCRKGLCGFERATLGDSRLEARPAGLFVSQQQQIESGGAAILNLVRSAACYLDNPCVEGLALGETHPGAVEVDLNLQQIDVVVGCGDRSRGLQFIASPVPIVLKEGHQRAVIGDFPGPSRVRDHVTKAFEHRRRLRKSAEVVEGLH
jgi:hypothetical protein